jgi:hypothetical protein
MRSSDQVGQIMLMQMWRDAAQRGAPLPGFDDVWFRDYSQNGEDGILLYVFSLIGTTNRLTVEMCAGNGIECNSANLILNHGFWGLLFDGDEAKVRQGDEFYSTHQDSANWKPMMIHEWITRDNVNDLISANWVSGDIDLFALDMDGNDYWILEALEVVRPRVLMVEYESAWGAEEAMTQVYQDQFRSEDVTAFGTLPRYGASLAAFVKLAARKGYRLVGVERQGFNAVFVRSDLGIDVLPTVAAADCFRHPMPRYRVQFLKDHRDRLDMTRWQAV